MKFPALSKACAIGAVVGVLGFASACSGGSGNNSSACSSMRDAIQHISSTTMSQISDPSAMAKTYHDGAESVRTTANGASGDVKTAGLRVATALDGLGTSVESLTGSTSVQMPDTSDLISAGTELQNACN